MPTAQLLVSGLLSGALYALLGVSLSLVFGVMRLVNFALGDLIMLAMYGTLFMWAGWGFDPFIAVPIIGLVGFVVGAGLYVGVLRPIVDKVHYLQVFTTLGLGLAIQNSALFGFSASYRTIRTPYSGATVDGFGVIVSVPRLVGFCVALVIGGVLFWYLRYTDRGRAIRATAQDPVAASALGINTDGVYRSAFALSTAIAGVAGVLFAPVLAIHPRVGEDILLVGFVVVVLGGLGSFPGALLGGVLIGLTETFSGYLVGEAVKQACYFGLLIVVLLVRPAGLFGQRGAEEYKPA